MRVVYIVPFLYAAWCDSDHLSKSKRKSTWYRHAQCGASARHTRHETTVVKAYPYHWDKIQSQQE